MDLFVLSSARGHTDAFIDRGRKHEALVIVRVLADQVHPPGRPCQQRLRSPQLFERFFHPWHSSLIFMLPTPALLFLLHRRRLFVFSSLPLSHRSFAPSPPHL